MPRVTALAVVLVATIVPLPEVVRLAPVLTIIAAVVFVPPVMASNDGVPPVASAAHSQAVSPALRFKI